MDVSLPSFFPLWKYSLSIPRTFLDLKRNLSETWAVRGIENEKPLGSRRTNERNADGRVVKKKQCSSLFRYFFARPRSRCRFLQFSPDTRITTERIISVKKKEGYWKALFPMDSNKTENRFYIPSRGKIIISLFHVIPNKFLRYCTIVRLKSIPSKI